MYEHFYNFSSKPFRLSPDPRFFFSSRTHKRALAYLRYGIEQGEGFIVITGDVGTGKTTLVSRLLDALRNENILIAKVVTTQLRAEDLLRILAAEFELPYERVTKAVLLKSLETFFRSCVQEGKRVLLIIDEAQNLPRKAIEELRMLSNFQFNGRPLLQSFLLGQKEFRNIMRGEGLEQLRQRVIAAYHLRPLDAVETREYIEHRLKVVGWKDDPSITAEAHRDIFDFTGGIPRKTNLLCDRVLLYGSLEEIHSIDHATMQIVLDDVRQELWQTDDYILEHADAQAPALSADGTERDLALEAIDSDAAPVQNRDELQAGKRAGDQNRRLSEVEESVKLLTESLRDELRALREAVTDVKKPADDES